MSADIIIETIMPVVQGLGVVAIAVFSVAKAFVENREIARLKKKIRRLFEKPLEYDEGVYRDKDKVPYCPGCFDGKNLVIHLKTTVSSFRQYLFNCPVCKEEYATREFQDGDTVKSIPGP